MTATPKDPRAVIEQLVTALGKLLGPENYESEDLVNAWTALTAGREALDTQGEVVAWMHLEMGTCFSAAQWAVKNSKDPLSREFVPLCVAQPTVEKCTDERMCAACYSGQGSCENAAHPQAREPAPSQTNQLGEHECLYPFFGTEQIRRRCIHCNELEAAPSTAGEAPDTKEMKAVGALLAAMHEHGHEGAKVREAMQWALGYAAQPAQGEWAGIIERLQYVAKDSVNQSMRDLAGKAAALLQSTLDARPVGEPVQFLCDATRFKVRQHEGDEAGRIYGLPSELNGRWVALVAADDNCHIAAARTQP